MCRLAKSVSISAEPLRIGIISYCYRIYLLHFVCRLAKSISISVEPLRIGIMSYCYRLLLLYFVCRLAKSVSLSVEPLQIGSPGFLPERSSYGNHYFIAALVPLTLEPSEEANPSCPPQLIPTPVGPRYATPGRRFTTLPSTGPFEGLLMGVLLGRGTFGRVYRGLWKGQLVAVKVTTKLLIIYRRSS